MTIANWFQQLLDEDSVLHFELLRLELIELIRSSFEKGDNIEKVEECIKFAAKNLAPRAVTNQRFAKELERTMALLCFPGDSISPQISPLLDLDLRREVADYVNEAIIMLYGESGKSKLETLIRMWHWGDQSLNKEGYSFPSLEFT